MFLKDYGGCVDAVLQETGRIDVLVNSAGIAGPAAYLWEQTGEDWERTIAINLTGWTVLPIHDSHGSPQRLLTESQQSLK